MNDNIDQHDPVLWKAILVFVWAIITEHLLPWTYHLAATLSTALVSYFLFNWIRNYATNKSDKYPWIKPFLFKK